MICYGKMIYIMCSGPGVLLEGVFQKKGKHIIIDSKGVKVSLSITIIVYNN